MQKSMPFLESTTIHAEVLWQHLLVRRQMQRGGIWASETSMCKRASKTIRRVSREGQRREESERSKCWAKKIRLFVGFPAISASYLILCIIFCNGMFSSKTAVWLGFPFNPCFGHVELPRPRILYTCSAQHEPDHKTALHALDLAHRWQVDVVVDILTGLLAGTRIKFGKPEQARTGV